MLPVSQLHRRLTALLLLVRAPRSHSSTALPDQGFTLLECLMAIAVIGLTVTMITPPLFIAAATRVQNRRAEQAVQLAQGEIDRIRVLVARGDHTVARLPKTVGNTTNLAGIAAPASLYGSLKSANTTCNQYNNGQVPVTQVIPIDVDGDCNADFMMQVFRTEGNIATTEKTARPDPQQQRPSDFQLGVRVYSILAKGNWANLKTDQASLQLTSGDGSQRQRPLAVVYSNFSWSEQSNTLCSYHNGGTNIAGCSSFGN